MSGIRFRIKDIRLELSAIAGRQICNDTWTRWRQIANIRERARTCSELQWKFLCAAVSLQCDGKAVNRGVIVAFLKQNPEPREFLPDYVPFSICANDRVIDDGCKGKDLADQIWERIRRKPSERTLRRWLIDVGFGSFDPDRMYSREQVNQLCAHRLHIQEGQRRRGRLLSMSKLEQFA